MKTVGVRELKARLSAYLREVRAGETLQITDRGEAVAELRPIKGRPYELTPEERFQRAVDEGYIIPSRLSASEKEAVWERFSKMRGAGLPPGTAQQLVDEDRKERDEDP